jgi:hypothetical protein
MIGTAVPTEGKVDSPTIAQKTLFSVKGGMMLRARVTSKVVNLNIFLKASNLLEYLSN